MIYHGDCLEVMAGMEPDCSVDRSSGGDGAMTCAKCGLAVCACRSGKTRVTAAGETPEAAKVVAEGYLARRGYSGTLLGVRRRRTRLGIMGYRAWDLTYRVARDA